MLKFLNHRYVFVTLIVTISVTSHSIAQTWEPHLLANTTLRVDYLAGTAQGDGSDWGTSAFKFLQDAIDLARNQNTPKPVAIWVRGQLPNDPDFVYRPDQGAGVTSGSRSATFQMANDIRWYGGFAGNEPHILAGFRSRDPYGRPTVLSGELGDPDLRDDNSIHVVTAVDVLPSSIIDGFIITRGNPNIGTGGPANLPPQGCGGGMVILRYASLHTRARS